MFSKTITVYNRKYEREKRADVYKRTVLNGVHVEKTQAGIMDDKRVKVNDSLFVIIPFSIPGYVKPKEYQALENADDNWTLHEGDIIIIGDIDKDIESSRALKDLDDVYTITSTETVDYAVSIQNHYEVYAS